MTQRVQQTPQAAGSVTTFYAAPQDDASRRRPPVRKWRFGPDTRFGSSPALGTPTFGSVKPDDL